VTVAISVYVIEELESYRNPELALIFYLIVPALALSALGGVGIFAPRYLSILIINMLILPISCLAAEIYFRSTDESSLSLRPSPSQVLIKLRESDPNAVIAYYPYLHFDRHKELEGTVGSGNVFPVSGIAGRKTILCDEGLGMIVYDSDRHGFRNKDSVWRSGNTVDAILIGDSFAHGSCVEDPDTLANQLMTNDLTIVNLGFGSNGPLIELATLAEYGSILRPRTTYWLYTNTNDLTDLKIEQNTPVLMRYLKEDGFKQDLVKRRDEIANSLRGSFELLLNNYLASESSFTDKVVNLLKLKKLRNRLGILRSSASELRNLVNINYEQSEQIPLFRDVLKRASSIVAEWDGSLVLVIVSGYSSVIENFPAAVEQEKAIVNIATELGMCVILSRRALQATDDPKKMFLYEYSHYSPAGYATVAKAIRTSEC